MPVIWKNSKGEVIDPYLGKETDYDPYSDKNVSFEYIKDSALDDNIISTVLNKSNTLLDSTGEVRLSLSSGVLDVSQSSSANLHISERPNLYYIALENRKEIFRDIEVPPKYDVFDWKTSLLKEDKMKHLNVINERLSILSKHPIQFKWVGGSGGGSGFTDAKTGEILYVKRDCLPEEETLFTTIYIKELLYQTGNGVKFFCIKDKTGKIIFVTKDSVFSLNKEKTNLRQIRQKSSTGTSKVEKLGHALMLTDLKLENYSIIKKGHEEFIQIFDFTIPNMIYIENYAPSTIRITEDVYLSGYRSEGQLKDSDFPRRKMDIQGKPIKKQNRNQAKQASAQFIAEKVFEIKIKEYLGFYDITLSDDTIKGIWNMFCSSKENKFTGEGYKKASKGLKELFKEEVSKEVIDNLAYFVEYHNVIISKAIMEEKRNMSK